jgi:hypothetical protein
VRDKIGFAGMSRGVAARYLDLAARPLSFAGRDLASIEKRARFCRDASRDRGKRVSALPEWAARMEKRGLRVARVGTGTGRPTEPRRQERRKKED